MALPASPVTAVLQNTALFSAPTTSELAALADRTRVRSCGPGELLFSEGEPCSGLFVVATGRVRIFNTSPGGREQVLAIEGPGGSVAELPFLTAALIPLR